MAQSMIVNGVLLASQPFSVLLAWRCEDTVAGLNTPISGCDRMKGRLRLYFVLLIVT